MWGLFLDQKLQCHMITSCKSKPYNNPQQLPDLSVDSDMLTWPRRRSCRSSNSYELAEDHVGDSSTISNECSWRNWSNSRTPWDYLAAKHFAELTVLLITKVLLGINISCKGVAYMISPTLLSWDPGKITKGL